MNISPTAKHSYFTDLYRASDDPYAVRTRWYEQRKRQLLLASLPSPSYANAFEPGCGVGELTVGLAARCTRLLASDFTEDAVQIARQRTAPLTNVEVIRQTLPADWPHPSAPFDLIVLSEMGYFLDADSWAQVVDAIRTSLAPGGTLVACDWLPDFAERAQPTRALHAALDGLGLHTLVRHEEADFLLRVWSADERSVAQRERIR
ncbi:class I SAM-dependent methyltransferase [Xylophilus sp. GOD-11R]|uniref:class I SAM-dependent methyltransferase n=1 Tax=Xylophilus sp. GOD-11R TaxID=3089814 RepID=UPI00298C886A|nr:class I SAM-dependent methyltransferase [Xylophilus sp. GOD-11R]WPB55758.1 class I SAM-dependent methyltransferase [Xylophilus sp. GOD-11R]